MFEFVDAWGPIIAALLSGASWLFVYYVRSEASTKVNEAEKSLRDQLSKAEDALRGHINATTKSAHQRVDTHADRIAALEAAWNSLPSRDDFHRMALSFESMLGDVKATRTEMAGMRELVNTEMASMKENINQTRHAVGRINQYLLDEKKPG